MAISYYEGLPRSGKSYSCVSIDIANALRAGRPVEAYVDGLNHEKIAPLVGLSVERCQELLKYLPEDQVMRIPFVTRDNALIVIDELQNFFPQQRKPLDADWTKFVAEHGHRGLDIVGMGQDFSGIHKFWRARTKTKVLYNKLDAVGLENKFNAKAFTATGPEKFVQVSDEISSYDPKWFGTYKSHTGANIQTANYKDKRASILNANIVRYGLPLSIVAALAGTWVVYRFFTGSAFKKDAPTVAATPAPRARTTTTTQAPRTNDKPPASAGALSFVAGLNAKYRPRLAGWTGPLDGDASDGVIEWWEGEAVRERLTFDQIRALGTNVRVRRGIARVGEQFVTHWPVTPLTLRPNFAAVAPVPNAVISTVGQVTQ